MMNIPASVQTLCKSAQLNLEFSGNCIWFSGIFREWPASVSKRDNYWQWNCYCPQFSSQTKTKMETPSPTESQSYLLKSSHSIFFLHELHQRVVHFQSRRLSEAATRRVESIGEKQIRWLSRSAILGGALPAKINVSIKTRLLLTICHLELLLSSNLESN